MRISAYFSILFLTINAAVLGSCGGGTASSPPGPVPAPMAAAAGGWLTALPDDTAQPWESVDGQGYVARGTSALPPTSEFQPGVERSLEGGSVLDLGEASEVSSGSSGSGELSYAVYRLTMGGVQPGALALDINLHPLTATTASPYYVAVSDYGNGYWKWLGPYTDGQLTLQLDTSLNYLSPLGNFFVAIGAYDGASFDIVGVLASQLDGADTTAPPAPTPPALTPVAGGLELTWNDVIAADLAGYRIHYSYSPFTASSDPGVQQWPHLENTTRFVLPLQPRTAFIALQAVDVNGNSSALSPVASALPLPGSHSDLTLDVTAPSVLLNEPATLSFSGADLFDIDANGDGSFEATDIPAGTFAVDTSGSGLIRPRVRGHDAGGTSVALGSVSLIVTGNQRPVAVARVDITSGVVPFDVNFIGSESGDDDGTIVEYAWDRTGNGSYENVSTVDPDTTGTYTTPGLYNVRLRVTDDQGAWDVDTVTVQAQAFVLDMYPEAADIGEPVTLSVEPLPGATQYEWDLNGNGTYETNGGTQNSYEWSFPIAGIHTVGVQVTSPSGLAQTAATLVVHGWRFTHDIATGTNTGYNLSLAVVGGAPAFAFEASDALMYVRAADSLGKSWLAPVTVVAVVGETHGIMPSLEVVDGKPAIAYKEDFNDDLIYVRADDALGDTWGAPLNLDNTNNVGRWPTLVVVNGNPAIGYVDLTLEDIRYIRASDATGILWDAIMSPFSSANAEGDSCSMAVVNGAPAMVFSDITSGFYRYIRATDPDGGAWGAPVDIGDDPSAYGCSLTVIGGVPACAFRDAVDSQVYFQWALDPDGAAWPMYFDAILASSALPGETLFNPQLAAVGGRAMIAYQNWDTFQSKLSQASSTQNLDFTSAAMDVYGGDSASPGRPCEVAQVAGRAGFAFSSATDSTYGFALLY